MSDHPNDHGAGASTDAPRSRRAFLRGTVSASAASAALLTSPPLAHAKPPAKKPFPPLPDLFPGENVRTFFEILQDEEDHITQLTKLADNPRPMPTFQNLLAATPQEFVKMAAMIENGGVGVYIQGLNAISQGGHHDYFLTAAGITAVEAQHTGFLNALLNSPIAPSAQANQMQPGIAPPIPPQQIAAAIAPLIVSLNGGPPFTFDINQGDDANDQAIINFVLLLEYLEVEFYRMNIAKFFKSF